MCISWTYAVLPAREVPITSPPDPAQLLARSPFFVPALRYSYSRSIGLSGGSRHIRPSELGNPPETPSAYMMLWSLLSTLSSRLTQDGLCSSKRLGQNGIVQHCEYSRSDLTSVACKSSCRGAEQTGRCFPSIADPLLRQSAALRRYPLTRLI